jgi:hypothetical protein
MKDLRLCKSLIHKKKNNYAKATANPENRNESIM